MADPARQFRLLLWKDFLIRKRKLITLAGIIWATLVMCSLYSVRVNVDNKDFPTCQFPARALPSAGMVTFLQSFICSVNNECETMDLYEEIPYYNNSKLTKIQKQISPLLQNDTVLEVAAAVPDALKLLGTLSKAADEPTFLHISQNGLRVKELFRDKERVKRYVMRNINLTENEVNNIMEAEISFMGLIKGHTDKCNWESLSETLKVKDEGTIQSLSENICPMSDKQLQTVLMNLIVEMDFSKYVKMIGNMYSKLNGDTRITTLADTLTAVLRISSLQSFVPPELVGILIQGDLEQFRYYNLTIINKLLDLYEPTFGNTEAYQTIRGLSDGLITGIQWYYKLVHNRDTTKSVDDTTGLVLSRVDTEFRMKSLEEVKFDVSSALDSFQKAMKDGNFLDDVFAVLPKLSNFVLRWLPNNIKHDIMFYSTLLSKLIDGATTVISININMADIAYNISKNNLDGVRKIVDLPIDVVGNAFDALTDADRTLLMTAKVSTPDQMFCDVTRLEKFFNTTKAEAENIMKFLCSDEWKKYISELITGFGIHDVKKMISEMASLFIQETLGRDTTAQLYPTDQCYQILKDFVKILLSIEGRGTKEYDWSKILNVNENGNLMEILNEKAGKAKEILITVHGSLAKEVIKMNPILELRIAPILKDTTTVVQGIKSQLDLADADVVETFKKMYPKVLQTMLTTLLDEEKTYSLLSTHSVDVFCEGTDTAMQYVDIDDDIDSVVDALCGMSKEIEKGLEADSVIGKTIKKLQNTTHVPFGGVNWTKLITGLKSLYNKLYNNHPYLFEFATYNMDDRMKGVVDSLMTDVQQFWFGSRSLSKAVQLSINCLFRLLDTLDRDVFNITHEMWLKLKHSMNSANGLLTILDEIVKLITAISNKNVEYTGSLPPLTVAALKKILSNLVYLIVESTDIVINNNTELEPIIEILNADPPWPCSLNSLSSTLNLTEQAREAIIGFETLLCMDRNLQMEWEQYVELEKVKMFTTFNKTKPAQYDPHLFLELSSNFDALIRDSNALKVLLDDAVNSDNTTFAGAWEYVIESFNTSERDDILRSLMAKIDIVLSQVNTSTTEIYQSIPLNVIWELVMQCNESAGADCMPLRRTAWVKTLMFSSVMLGNMAQDVLTYVQEINDPNVSLLQTLGFTRNTGLYILYDKMADFLGVLLNSYWDFGFMNQIRKASKSSFWDCDAVVEALVIPTGSRVTAREVDRVRPFICPSLLYWLSLPRGENSLLDVVSKPQYYFYTLEAENLTSNFEETLKNILQLTKFLTEIPQKNFTELVTETNEEINSIKGKFNKLVDQILDWKVDENDSSYVLFNEINKKQFISSLYLTRIVTITNKIQQTIENFNTNDTDVMKLKIDKLNEDLLFVKKNFQRKPTDTLQVHFDLITKSLWDDDNFTLSNTINSICQDLKVNKSISSILAEDKRFLEQLCVKEYAVIYKVVQKAIAEDYVGARKSLQELIMALNVENNDLSDVYDFFNSRQELKKTLINSLKYADDLSTPIYLKYLQSNLKNYGIILKYLSGEDWWSQLRIVYNGPLSNNFFDTLENSIDIVDDVLKNADNIHLVRLLRDININDTEAFCQTNVTLSDYIPDRTGFLSLMKQQVCQVESETLYAELPIMVLVSQGFDNSLTLSKEIDYPSINQDIDNVESKLDIVRSGPKTPKSPSWVTEDRIEELRRSAKKLLSKEMLVKISFGVISNIADAATLFLNNSECHLCSPFTSWFKQLNLQLYKKQEYDTLLCHLDSVSLDKLYLILNHDFHWDMALRELISTRNYTKNELNKSVNEFIGQVKLHLLDDLTANQTKLTECLVSNVSRNEFGNATLLLSVLSRTIKLLRAQVPHLSEVPGFKNLTFVKQMHTEIAKNLPVEVTMETVLSENDAVEKVLKESLEKDFYDIMLNGSVLLLELKHTPNDMTRWFKLANSSWEEICLQNNCTKITEAIISNFEEDWLDEELPKQQTAKFYTFDFISSILTHIESVLSHGSRLLGVASKVDVGGAMEGNIAAILDFLLQVLQDVDINAVLYSISGIAEQLHPLLNDTLLDVDLGALVSGLRVIAEFKGYVIEEVDLKIPMSDLFATPEKLEHDLNSLGINNTNFWSIAAPRIHAGSVDLKPLLTIRQEQYRISHYICQSSFMEKIIQPANVDVVTLDDIYGAVVEQFCALDDATVKKMLPAFISSLNYTFVMDKLASLILTQVYEASNLTTTEGASVMALYPQMMALLPTVQASVGNITESFAKEPLFEALKDFSSVNGLLSSSEFLASAGNMLCGKPFAMDNNRFFKAIVESEDFSNQPDPMQLDVLPTDFCRSLYTDILSMSGGKIVWSLVKPLLMGKILYTPQTVAVERIIQKANSSFAQIASLTSIIHNFVAAFPSIHQMSDHRAGVKALRKVLTSPLLHGVVNEGGNEEKLDIDGLFEEFGDLNGIESLIQKASNLLRCINLNRFHSAPSEEKLANQAALLTRINEFSAGIVFMDVQEQNGLPYNVSYKIRMDIDTVPTTSRIRNQFWTPGPESNFLENLRYFRGFVQIQDLIDSAIIEMTPSAPSGRRKRQVAEDAKVDLYTQQMPYPCYRKDYFQSSLYESQALIVAFFFAFVFSVASAIRFIIVEKESGITMLMSIMGVSMSRHTLSWFVACFIEGVVTTLFVCVVLCVTVVPRTDPTLLAAIIVVFSLSTLSFCYMLSKLFKSASMGSVCGGLLFMISFMPYVIILSLEAVLSDVSKILTCLSMSSAFCYSLLHVARLEAIGVGAHWGDLRWADDGAGGDVTLGITTAMMLVDAVIYVAIGFLLEKYTGIKTLKSNITYCRTSSEKAGVSIVNVTKVYHEGTRKAKLALDQVSIELHQGQITTLLGHNGAGKTTLIKIITGMLRPSRGHIVVRHEGVAGATVGLCPQHDVLYENLTAEEHLRLYVQLKGTARAEDIEREVQRMVSHLCGGAGGMDAGGGAGGRHVPVRLLSGGWRRRVCVWLAFAGVPAPRLVLLDEPASGVDPAARRDIWSLIMRLKEDRTVLMTTHHLDEAELLSDQIVIMHKGQVHTTGSPVDIKRTLGNGYTLTVLYPREADDDDSRAMEKVAERLLYSVQDVVKNAELVEVEGPRVDLLLPTFTTDGVPNNYLQLCTMLESRQTELGFSNFSLECSSLEQVMYNICNSDSYTKRAIGSPETSTKSSSSASVRADTSPLVPPGGKLSGTVWEQFCALLEKRYLHYKRNTWLLFLLFVVPSLFVTIAMAFSMIRPPPDNEISLRLTPTLYPDSSQFAVDSKVLDSQNSSYGSKVIRAISKEFPETYWVESDNPTCNCTAIRQECDYSNYTTYRPEMMLLPNVSTANDWLITTQEAYIEKRYVGYSSAQSADRTHFTAWYNNKGPHALPAAINAINAARLKVARGGDIRTYTHPLKISKEQLSKSTLLQHVADAGISALVLVAWSLLPAAGAAACVREARSGGTRLARLAAVPPAVIAAATHVADIVVVIINIGLTACVLSAFGFPVFVAQDNLAAICLLLLLFGFSCNALVHLLSNLFSEASMSTMVLFCGNVFMGLSGIAVLLILDIISESERTDNARWYLHKVLMIAPQFALGDGLLEIAKNTIQAQVLSRFGMDTYKSPLYTDLIAYHYLALLVVGIILTAINLLIEYGVVEDFIWRFKKVPPPMKPVSENEDVTSERRRVAAAIASGRELRIKTIGNINSGFSDTEGLKTSIQQAGTVTDALSCVSLTHAYSRRQYALNNLTLGLPQGQCTVLLGENGAGKSTTFSILTGEIRPTSGQVYLLGEPATRRDICSGIISYCPQTDAIDDLLTVKETLNFYCKLRGIEDRERVISRTLEAFELTSYTGVLTKALSGGNKRKLCSAIAFMSRCPIILLDEPTSGMDPVSRGCVVTAARTARGGGAGVLLSTHGLRDAAALATRLALLHAARLRAASDLRRNLYILSGGYVVVCRAAPGRSQRVWDAVKSRAGDARLLAVHHAALQFLIYTSKGQDSLKLSDIFRMLAELQSAGDIEDYTLNQSSLEQMFLNDADTHLEKQLMNDPLMNDEYIENRQIENKFMGDPLMNDKFMENQHINDELIDDKLIDDKLIDDKLMDDLVGGTNIQTAYGYGTELMDDKQTDDKLDDKIMDDQSINDQLMNNQQTGLLEERSKFTNGQLLEETVQPKPLAQRQNGSEDKYNVTSL